MLGALRFELTAPTPRAFLRRLAKAALALGPADPRCAPPLGLRQQLCGGMCVEPGAWRPGSRRR